MIQHLIIGGSDAGISAALRIKEIDPKAPVTVMATDAYPNFSICGLPFYLSGEVKDWRTLAHRTVEQITKHGIDLLLDHKALSIDPQARQVQARSSDGNKRRIRYGKLLIATGAESAKPPIEGLENPGAFFLRWLDDSFAVRRFMDQKSPKKAVIIGTGPNRRHRSGNRKSDPCGQAHGHGDGGYLGGRGLRANLTPHA